MRILIILFIICSSLVSCVDPFDISDELKNNAGGAVINGWISNFPSDYRIYVSRTVLLNDTSSAKPISDASVVVKNGNGDSFDTIYDDRAKNYSLPNLFEGMEGETYWVEVTFSDGQVFQSIPEVLKSSLPINNISLGQHLGFNSSLGGDLKEVIANYNDPPNVHNYYLWLTENLFHTPIRADSRLYNIEDDLLFDGQLRDVFVSQATATAPLLVRQLNISRTGYKFFDLLNQLNEQQEFDSQDEDPVDPISNGLFAKPPLSLEGNIFEKNNPTNFGSGYFGVYGQTAKALVDQSQENPLELNSIFENTCEIRISNGVVSVQPGFESCITFPSSAGQAEDGWRSYVFQEDLDSYFHSTYFNSGLSFRKISLRSNSVHAQFKSKVRTVGSLNNQFFVENLYLLVEDGFSGTVNLEIEATNFTSTKVARYILHVE